MTAGRRAGIAAALALLAGGGGLVFEQAWLAVKARIAAVRIEAAFEAHLEDGRVHPPWSWADTHPVARLEVPRLGLQRTVLSGASGSSLAFGPGHVHGTAAPNERGNCVLAGHRDSWFAFLRDLRGGDEIRLQSRGKTLHYVVSGTQVVSMWDFDASATAAEEQLTLITCYPFDGLTTTDRRYVVRLEKGTDLFMPPRNK